jgi:hypothetical protein
MDEKTDSEEWSTAGGGIKIDSQVSTSPKVIEAGVAIVWDLVANPKKNHCCYLFWFNLALCASWLALEVCLLVGIRSMLCNISLPFKNYTAAMSALRELLSRQ